MENKINIAELLRNCPTGMELDCTTWENVSFEEVKNDTIIIKRNYKIPLMDNIVILNKYGCLTNHKDEKCRIFPKGKTTWEGFVPPVEFKDGDVIFTHGNCLKVGLGNTWISIFQEKRNGGVATYVDLSEDGEDYYDYIDGSKGFLCMDEDIMRQRLATEEEKRKLFDAIKDNGYKWNVETKTLEKLIKPKFKVGDKVKHKCDKNNIVITITCLKHDCYYIQYYNNKNEYQNEQISFTDQDKYELIIDKFNITTLKPFDKVLMRSSNAREWVATLYSHYSNNKFYGCGMCCNQCIPYEENKHLLGTTADCNDYYKI